MQKEVLSTEFGIKMISGSLSVRCRDLLRRYWSQENHRKSHRDTGKIGMLLDSELKR